MIDIKNIRGVYLYTSNVDMRFGIFAIQRILSLSFTPIEIIDSLFIFVSRDRKTIKIYYENEYGNWLFINKMKYYKFQVKDLNNATQISLNDVDKLLKGVELTSKIVKQKIV